MPAKQVLQVVAEADWLGRGQPHLQQHPMHAATGYGSRVPALPARCSADACDTGTVCSLHRSERGSKAGCLERPASTTARTPGSVMLDSAIEVARITRRRPALDSPFSSVAIADEYLGSPRRPATMKYACIDGQTPN